MKHQKNSKVLITVLCLLIATLSIVATAIGVLSNDYRGPDKTLSVRGKEIVLHARGVYHHMSAEVAPQGIAQDYVTLFIGVPLLLWSTFLFRRGSLRGKVILTGVAAYFLVTYGFYTLLAMYNQLFLLWVLLLSLSFHTFFVLFKSIDEQDFINKLLPGFPTKFVGYFLIITSIAVGLLWLSVVLPSALSGVIPPQVEHYTTLVVQAIDLSILLPGSFIAGWLLLKRDAFGYKLATVYIIALTLQMAALTAKIVAMGILGYNIIPVVFIMPTFLVLAFIGSTLCLRKVIDQAVTMRMAH